MINPPFLTDLTFELNGFAHSCRLPRRLAFNFSRDSREVQILAAPEETSMDMNIIATMTIEEFYQWVVDLSTWALTLRSIGV